MEDILLVLAMITDTFFVSFSYSCRKIKIPAVSAVIISLVSSAVLTLSLCFSQTFCMFIPQNYCRIIGAVILGIIGIIQFCRNRLRSVLQKHSGNGSISFSCFNFGFVIKVYLDETQADSDRSKLLSAKESIALALALSVDSVCGGAAAGISGSNILRTGILSFIFGLMAVASGKKLGETNKLQRYDLSWISGVFLILLALVKLF